MVLTLLLLFGLLSTPVATPVGLPSAPDWIVPTGSAIEEEPGAGTGPLIVGDRVIVATADRTLLALDTLTGAAVWTTALAEGVIAPMAAHGDMLLVPGGQGTLLAIDLETGTMTHAVVLGAEPLLEPLVINESIVVGDVRGTVHIIDVESLQAQAPVVLGGTLRHASIAGGLAVFTSTEGMVSAIDPATGSEAWQAVVTGEPAQMQVVSDGIALGMVSGDLVMLNAADGTLRWHQAIVASPFTDIALTGTAVLGITKAGDLLAVDAATGAPVWRDVLPTGGWFAGNRCDPACPVVTSDGSVFLLAPGLRGHPMPVTALPEIAIPPAATGDVLVVVTGQGDVYGWVLNPD